MLDVQNKEQMSRLRESLKNARQQLKPGNARAYNALKAYVGPQYGPEDDATAEEGIEDPSKYLNLMARAVDTFSDRLVPENPRVSIQPNPDSERGRYLRPIASTLTAHVNQRLKKERVGKELRAAVVQSLFGYGAVKVALASQGSGDAYGHDIDISAPFIKPILMEDLVIDVSAKELDPGECGFIGHRFCSYLDEALADESYDPAERQKLKAGDDEDKGLNRFRDLATQRNDNSSYLPEIELWEIFLPREQLVLTFGPEFESLLKVVEWTGPARGPIHPLCLREVPGCAIPRGIALEWCPLDLLMNDIFAKLGDQARRQKTFTTCKKGDEADATAVGGVSDGQIIGMNHPDSVTEHSMGGPNQVMVGFFQWAQQLFSAEAGNLELMAGLGPQTDTATQDSILNNNSGALIKALAARVIPWIQGVLEDYTFWIFTDPVETLTAELFVPQAQITLPMKLTPEQRTHDFYLYALDVEPYSLAAKTPEARKAAIADTLARFQPFIPLMQQQGLAIDFGEVLRQWSEAAGNPDLLRLFKSAGVPMDGASGQPPPQDMHKPHRTEPYHRISSSQANNPQAQQAQNATALMAGGPAGGRN